MSDFINIKVLVRKLQRYSFCLLALFFCVCVEVPDCVDGYPCGNYNLTINAGTGGTVTPSGQRSVTAGISFNISASANSGYEFVNWELASGEALIANKNNRSTTVTLSSNAVIAANFQRLLYTITFNPQNGTVSPTSGTTGTNGRLSTLPTPARSGYTFDGWFILETGGTEVTTDYVFNSDATIYAQWTNSYTVIYNINGGTGITPSTQTVNEGNSVTLSDGSGFTMSSFTFDGWNTDENGTGTNYAAGSSFTLSSNITLYAKWTDASHIHDWGDWSLRNPPSCTEPGDSIRVCKLNSEHEETKEIAQLSGSACFTHTYDGKAVEIGNLTWMAENLNYAGPNNDIGVCYDNEPDSCAKYGRLYTWVEAMQIESRYISSTYGNDNSGNHRGICPVGWRLPNDSDWDNLIRVADPSHTSGSSDNTAGSKLKSKTGWYNNGNGTDDYGFSALPGGDDNNSSLIGGGSFGNAGYSGGWWSATEIGWLRYMLFDSVYVGLGRNNTGLFSVRCVQNERP